MAENVKIVIHADDKASKEIQGVHGALDKLAGLGKAALFGGAAVATAAVAGLGSVLIDSVQAAMDAEEAQAQLAAVIESTGGVAGVTADMANRLASELQNVTRFEDDAVLQAENILLTFTNIGKDVFPDAMWAAADLSQALGQDLNTSVIQLGKALNDPIAGVSALQRVGVSFTDEQKDMIKELVNSNNTLDAQKLILQELQKEFGGSAVAAGDTFAGKLDILKNKLGDVKERIGGALIPALSTLVTELGPKLIEWADAFASWVETDGAKAISDFVDKFVEAIPKIEEFAGVIKSFLENQVAQMEEDFAEIQQLIQDAEQFFGDLGKALQDVARWWDGVTAAIQRAIDKLREWLGMQPSGPAGGGGSGAGSAPLYTDPTKGVYHEDNSNYRNGTNGNYMPWGMPAPAPANVTVNVNIAGNADPRTTRGAVLDALQLARARGMV